MSDWQENVGVVMRCLVKYGKMVLRYLLVALLWIIRELIIFCNWLAPKLKWMWRVMKVFARKAWKWSKVCGKHLIVFFKHFGIYSKIWAKKIYLWSLVAILGLGKAIVKGWKNLVDWTLHTKEKYEEFKRTKGVKGLVKDVGDGVRQNMHKYMDEDDDKEEAFPQSLTEEKVEETSVLSDEDSAETLEDEENEEGDIDDKANDLNSAVKQVGKKIDTVIKNIWE